MSAHLPGLKRNSARAGLYGRFRNQTTSMTRRTIGALLVSTAFVGNGLLTTSLLLSPATAQTLPVRQTDPNAQLLLKANQLIYNNDTEVVTAQGDVQLDYDGYKVVADEVSYDQKTRRVKARGRVEILEPDGNRIFADEIDLTDDFADGFVNALRVETNDDTRFAAESAERFAGQKTVFHHGVYTACKACQERPDKAPIWQVKAEKIILNGVEKTVTYRNARFELFGKPIAFLPYFSHADPSVKRKSGFLVPRIANDDDKGFSYQQAYFWAINDTQDITFTGTGFSKQGFLGQAKWRHQLDSGIYTLHLAGIRQRDLAEFENVPDRLERDRGLIATTGKFDINSRWSFGWDVMAQTDDSFANTYNIEGYSDVNITNQAYLRGLHDRSYFDLSGYYYDVQGSSYQVEDQQAVVLPTLDYNYLTTPEKLGGNLSLDINATRITRQDLSADTGAAIPANGDARTYGIDGDTTRASANLEWKKTYSSGGLLLTPALSVYADATDVSGFQSVNGTENVANGTTVRFMPKASLEASYPLLMRASRSSHIFEPVGQLLLRPDLNTNSVLPNEDAQSLVFDATTLFDHDKFSGYDRIESGTRANIGLRYSGVFSNGFSLNGLVGQSFHLAGDNPYRQGDLVNAGLESGLDTDVSDYVAALGLSTNSGLSLSSQARFDNTDFGLRRAELAAAYSASRWSAATSYTFIDAQPIGGFDVDRQQVNVSGSYKVTDNWTTFGSASFDIQNGNLISDSVGISYHDECFTFTLSFSESRDRFTGQESNREIGFKFSLRTIGDFDQSVDFDTLSDIGN